MLQVLQQATKATTKAQELCIDLNSALRHRSDIAFIFSDDSGAGENLLLFLLR
jgi:hypothetical protein